MCHAFLLVMCHNKKGTTALDRADCLARIQAVKKEYPAIVIKDHQTEFTEFIEAAPGDEVAVGEKYNANPEWKNWVWGRHCWSGVSGWIPEQLLDFQSQHRAVFNSAYSSLELNATEGETLLVLRELNGWAWCKNGDDREGWIPAENIKKL